MWAESTFHNRCEFDLEMRDIHESSTRQERSLPRGIRRCGGPSRVHSAAEGISSKFLAGTNPRAARSMSIRARSAIGTCRWPG
jgi:hypothetical protein